MRVEVLLLSSIYDFASDLVSLELKDDDIPFLRLNREQLSEFQMTLDPTGPVLTVRHGADAWEIPPDLRSVWFRQPIFLRNTPAEPLGPALQLEQSQWMAFLRGLRVFQSALWVNDPQATYLAESKPYQLVVARQIGFSVPPTLVGNDAEAVERAFSRPFVIKSLDTILLSEGEDTLFTYTTIRQESDGPLSIQSAPVIASGSSSRKPTSASPSSGTSCFRFAYSGKAAPSRGIGASCRRTIFRIPITRSTTAPKTAAELW